VVAYQHFIGPCCLHLQGEGTGSGKNSIDMGLECRRAADAGSRKAVVWQPVLIA